MSVIAKMSAIADARAYGPNFQVDLSAVCDDRLMPANPSGKAMENRTFQTATPTGDCRFQVETRDEIRKGHEFYLIFVRQAEPPAFKDAIAMVDARCVSVTEFGGTSKQVEVCARYRYDYALKGNRPNVHPAQTDAFNLRMMIDNPAASIQFEAGAEDYWIGIYRASDHDMHEALELAGA